MAKALWCFTLNFSGEVPILSWSDRVQYAIWQHEKVSHDHLQGFLQLKKKATMSTVKKMIGGNPHVESAIGTAEEAAEYCRKPESRVSGPWEYGYLLKKGSNKRSLMEKYLEDPGNMELEEPGKARRCRARIDLKNFEENYKNPVFDREWQKELEQELFVGPNDRDIIWAYGPIGGEGKTTWAKAQIKKGWFYTRGGKKDDVTYSYIEDPTRHVVFDIPRDMQEYCNYSLIEMLKDRIIISNKYEPITNCQLAYIHVIVLANFLPDVTKISEDRIKIIYC